MIRKILIAEDHESASISVQKTLEDLKINNIEYVYYCDDALQKIQIGKQNNEPYDLLISDLYFEEDGQVQKISGGAALITAARQIQPDLKVLVFSAESKVAVIEKLYDLQEIDGYVRKARNDAKELKLAISTIDGNQHYFPRHLSLLLKKKNIHDFTEFDMAIISLLAQGVRQKGIPARLRQMKLRASGLSSVEKRLKQMKDALNFFNNEQLVAYCKGNGII